MFVIARIWSQTAAEQSPENQGLPGDYEGQPGLSQLSSEDAMIHTNKCLMTLKGPHTCSLSLLSEGTSAMTLAT